MTSQVVLLDLQNVTNQSQRPQNDFSHDHIPEGFRPGFVPEHIAYTTGLIHCSRQRWVSGVENVVSSVTTQGATVTARDPITTFAITLAFTMSANNNTIANNNNNNNANPNSNGANGGGPYMDPAPQNMVTAVPVPPIEFTPEAARLWEEASNAVDQFYPPPPLPPHTHPLKEECLLSLAFIAQYEYMARQCAKMRAMQEYLGVRGPF